MTDLVAKLKEYLSLYGLDVVAAAAILIVGRWGAKIVQKVVRRLMLRSKVEETLVGFVSNMAYIAMLAFVVVAALGKLGIQTTSFIAVLGAAGLAVGLALQGSLSNFAAGVLMIIFRPFKVGDFIEAAGKSGIVDSIEIFTTNIKTPDNKLITIPNSKITGDSITNFTANQTRRLDLVVGVGPSQSLDKAEKAIEAVLAADQRILKDPSPTISVLEMAADNSFKLAVRPWTKTERCSDVQSDMIKAIKQRLDADGISGSSVQ